MPSLSDDPGPKYRKLAREIARAMADGELQPGDRLPTHRELADSLGVALTTVTRGYAEAERRGLVVGEVGRGTFVRSWAPCLVSEEGIVADLSANYLPPRPQAPELFEQIFRRLARGGGRALLDYQPHRGTSRQIEAGAHWIDREGVAAKANQVVVTSGVQHAMAVVFAALAEPGDTILVEELTYCGFNTLARVLHLKLEPVPIDSEGLIPEALREACRRVDAKGLYCMPRLQNPTAVSMTDKRREEIAEISQEFALPVIEDDSYGFLAPESRPLSTLLPNAFYLCGTSKSVMPGLRIGFVRAPEEMTRQLESVIAATTYMAPALLADVTADWILDGTAERIMQWKRDE
ncbi:MAG: PLP-dependent aminotransferase family protein, partial [Acidobacteriota bacterium]